MDSNFVLWSTHGFQHLPLSSLLPSNYWFCVDNVKDFSCVFYWTFESSPFLFLFFSLMFLLSSILFFRVLDEQFVQSFESYMLGFVAGCCAEQSVIWMQNDRAYLCLLDMEATHPHPVSWWKTFALISHLIFRIIQPGNKENKLGNCDGKGMWRIVRNFWIINCQLTNNWTRTLISSDQMWMGYKISSV